MSWWQKLAEGITFISTILVQLQGANQTPVGGTATLSFDENSQALEVSEGGEHWRPVSQVWKRVK